MEIQEIIGINIKRETPLHVVYEKIDGFINNKIGHKYNFLDTKPIKIYIIVEDY